MTVDIFIVKSQMNQSIITNCRLLVWVHTSYSWCRCMHKKRCTTVDHCKCAATYHLQVGRVFKHSTCLLFSNARLQRPYKNTAARFAPANNKAQSTSATTTTKLHQYLSLCKRVVVCTPQQQKQQRLVSPATTTTKSTADCKQCSTKRSRETRQQQYRSSESPDASSSNIQRDSLAIVVTLPQNPLIANARGQRP